MSVACSTRALPSVAATSASRCEMPQVQAAPAASTRSSMNGLKLAGGALLLLVGVGLLALSLSASGRVRLKLPLALVVGGGLTLAQAINER